MNKKSLEALPVAFDHVTAYANINRLHHKILSVHDPKSWREFRIILGNLTKLQQKIAVEEVRCRRNNTQSNDYRKLCAEFDDAYSMLDDLVMMVVFAEL